MPVPRPHPRPVTAGLWREAWAPEPLWTTGLMETGFLSLWGNRLGGSGHGFHQGVSPWSIDNKCFQIPFLYKTPKELQRRFWNYLGIAMNGDVDSCNRGYFRMSNIVLLLWANCTMSIYIKLLDIVYWNVLEFGILEVFRLLVTGAILMWLTEEKLETVKGQ